MAESDGRASERGDAAGEQGDAAGEQGDRAGDQGIRWQAGASVPIMHGQLRTPSAFRAVARLLAVIVAVAVISAVCIGTIAVLNLTSSIKPGVQLIGSHSVPPAPMIGALPGEINVLLVGSDSAKNDPLYGPRGENLNDVTMLLHVSADHARATVVSFPRDMFVPIPECPLPDGSTFEGTDSAKFNTSLSSGGLPCTVLTVERFTGMGIPYAALIQFQGLIAMSDAVGGVPVCVAAEIVDTHQPFPFVLEPGEHTLKGAQALAFLRTRYGLATGSDLARSSNQRVFLSSLFRMVSSKDTLSNPVKVYSLAQAALDNMTFSKSLGNVPTMIAIAVALKDIRPDSMLLLQYPATEVPGGLEPNLADADALFEALKADQPLELSGGTGSGATVSPDGSASAMTSSSPSASAAPTSAATAEPSSSASPGDVTQLPSSVVGQTAAQKTCSIGRPLSEQ